MRHELTIVSVLLSVTALAAAQSRPTPGELVEQLAVAEQRGPAREQLLALGKDAVPALANRVSATERELRAEVLAILIELGPDAGAAVPQLAAAMRGSPDYPTSTLQALAELVPFRAPTSRSSRKSCLASSSRGSIAAVSRTPIRIRPSGPACSNGSTSRARRTSRRC